MAKRVFEIEYEESQHSLADFNEREVELLHRVIAICYEAKAAGNNPFGCLLADESGNILMEQGNEEVTMNGDCTAHAEALLMRKASQIYSKDEMGKLTMYSCAEPCCMCAGAMYWGNLGKLVYIGRESELKKVTGGDVRNPTLNLPVRVVLASGQKDMKIIGPILELEPEFLESHKGFWNP